MYKIQKSVSPVGVFGEPCAVLRLVDNATIPFDPANTDYQAFLAWCAEGNAPLPADDQQGAE